MYGGSVFKEHLSHVVIIFSFCWLEFVGSNIGYRRLQQRRQSW